MQLELTGDEAELLQEVLDSVIRDLRSEIADTDNPDYRRGLVDRRERLRALLAKVGGPLVGSP